MHSDNVHSGKKDYRITDGGLCFVYRMAKVYTPDVEIYKRYYTIFF